MSTGEGSARPKGQRLVEAVDAMVQDQDKRQNAYYGMLADRLEGLLKEIETAGTPPEDDLVQRLRSLHAEVRRQIDESGGK